LWGGKEQADIVRMGFTHGILLNNHDGFLEQGNRTQVLTHDFKSVEDIDEERIAELLYEAVQWDPQKVKK
jgi:hypothetical protein